jgi:hypothetical protein
MCKDFAIFLCFIDLVTYIFMRQIEEVTFRDYEIPHLPSLMALFQ